MEGDVITMQDLFVYEFTGEDAQGRMLGRHRSSGVRPHFYDKARYYGFEKELMSVMEQST